MRMSPLGAPSAKHDTGAGLRRVLAAAGVLALPVVGLIAAPAAQAAPAQALYVATAGTDTGNNCQVSKHPCATISRAVAVAEGLAGTVKVNIAPGTYAEQVTVTPSPSSKLASLTLIGQTRRGPVVIRPASLSPNVCEQSTGNFFDDNSGAISAIIGVQTGIAPPVTPGTCPASPGAGNQANVALADLTGLRT